MTTQTLAGRRNELTRELAQVEGELTTLREELGDARN